MNRLRSIEFSRPLATTAVAVGALLLAGCGSSGLNRRFARCDPKEVTGYQPVYLSSYELKSPYDISLLRKIIVAHPQALIDTARRIHPDPSNPDRDLLRHTYDQAHDTTVRGFESHDSINGPGDILCETRPFGDPSAPTRQVYYDQDGLNLVEKVDHALDKLSTNPIN